MWSHHRCQFIILQPMKTSGVFTAGSESLDWGKGYEYEHPRTRLQTILWIGPSTR